MIARRSGASVPSGQWALTRGAADDTRAYLSRGLLQVTRGEVDDDHISIESRLEAAY